MVARVEDPGPDGNNNDMEGTSEDHQSRPHGVRDHYGGLIELRNFENPSDSAPVFEEDR
ncbi:hypothetical protein [Nocardia sp. CA-120079]|uniref:hypothetical protein n=1 Tax=Nocardia sp. CA-120079 TaxID=3239974 RepID=UPI003D9749C2